MLKRKFYLKLLMSLLLTAFVVPQGHAETAEVGGSLKTIDMPINAGYGDYGAHGQMIYPSATLENAGLPAGAKITAITFYTADNANLTPSGSNDNPLTIKVGQPEASTLSGFITEGLTTVSTTGDLWSGNTSVTLQFDNEYPYDGGNLLIDLSWGLKPSGKYKTGLYWLASSATGAGYLSTNNSSGSVSANRVVNFLPKITITYTAEAKPYDAKVTPSSLAFGKLNTGESNTLNVTLTNKGENVFTPSLSGLAIPFSTTYTPAELASGESVEIPITYAPSEAGSFSETMTINCGEAGTFEVSLSGTAVEPGSEIVVCDGTDKNGYVPVYGMYYDTKDCQVQFIYPASALTALNGREITGVKFFPENTIMINGGKLQLSIKETEQTVFERETAIAKPNEITEMTVAATIVPNGTDNVLEFVFEEPFPYNGGNLAFETLVVEKNSYASGLKFLGENQSTNTAFYYYPSSGNLVQFLPKIEFASVKSGEVPTITVDPPTVETFTTEVGTPVTATVNVAGENLTGDITATVSGANADCFTAVLENGVLTITYNPTAAGNHTATVTLSSTGAQDVAIAFTGTATAPDYAVTISDNTRAHNYGNVLVNSSNVWTLTITNNGTKAVTPTLSGIEAPFSTTYTTTALAAGESTTIAITFAPTELDEYSNTITISFPEAGDAIAAYTCVLSGKAVDESYDPSDENEVVKLVTVDKRSIYEPAFIDNANGNTTPQQLNCYDMRFKMAQPDDPAKKIKAGDLRTGNNLYEFYAIDDFGTEFRFATINLFAEGEPSSNPSVSAMDAPIKVTPSVEYYTEDGMPVHPTYTHNTTLKYTEKIYNDINDLVDLEGVIDYVNDTWSANTATNSHPDHYKFQIRGVGQFGDFVTSLTADYVKNNRKPDGSLDAPEGWDYGMYVGPNNENDGTGVWQDTYYFYDLYISREFLESKGITGPVTVVINTTLSGSGYNADSYKTITVNGVEQIIAKEKFKDYSWTVPLLNEIPEDQTVAQVPMGIVIRSISGGSDFNKTKSIHIYGGTTGVSNVETVGIYKSSMNVKAYTQKQVDEDTDRNLVAMKVGNTETANADVNVLAYADPAVTGYKLNENSSASTTGMSQVATATHNENGSYTVNSVSAYSATYDFVRDESLGNIDGMWLPMYPADAQKYFLPVTIANGIGYDGVVRSEGNTYGSAMQQVEKNGSVDFSPNKICHKSSYTWQENGVTYAIYAPEVELTSELPAATGYELYNYRLWVDYDDNAPAWDFSLDDGHITLTDKMDRPLYSGQNTSIGGQGTDEKDEWEFIAPNDLEKVKLIARFYYKKTSTSNSPRIKARPTDSDRLYYVVEKQVTIPLNNIVTGIDNVTGKAVAGVKYYNVAGVESDRPFQGVNIEVTRYTDGSKSTRKILK